MKQPCQLVIQTPNQLPTRTLHRQLFCEFPGPPSPVAVARFKVVSSARHAGENSRSGVAEGATPGTAQAKGPRAKYKSGEWYERQGVMRTHRRGTRPLHASFYIWTGAHGAKSLRYKGQMGRSRRTAGAPFLFTYRSPSAMSAPAQPPLHASTSCCRRAHSRFCRPGQAGQLRLANR